MEIRILAKTRQKKGKLFERLMGEALNSSGYHNFRPRINYTGMEIDIKAEADHKATSETLLCECKAHNQPIGPKNLIAFFGKVGIKRSKNPNIKGIFASLSGFTSNALEVHDEYSPHDKLVYALLGNLQIQDLIRESGLLISDQEIDSKIKSKTNLSPGDRYLVYIESGIFIVQILLVGGKPSHYLILTGRGELVQKTIEYEITKLDKTIKSLVKIDLQILDSVTINLLDLKKKSIAQISREINETENDVSIAIEELRLSGLLDKKSRSREGVLFSMRTDMKSLSKLVRKYAFTARKYDFMTSAYIENTVNDDFATYVKDRFKLQLDPDKTTIIIVACRIFASVLHYVLLADNSPYILNYEQRGEQRKLREQDQEPRHISDNMEREFFDQIVTGIRASLGARDDNRVAYEKGIRGFHMVSTFKMASETDLIFSSSTESTEYLAIAGGTIRAGSDVMATDISVHLSIANTLRSLQLYDRAIKKFNDVIQLAGERQDILIAAWNNKGLALYNLGKHKEAIACYDKALEMKQDYALAWYNRACSKVKIRDIENAIADLKKAIGINKDYIRIAKQDKDFESIRDDEGFKALG